MSLHAVEQQSDPVDILVQETEHLHEELERLGDMIGLLSLRQELQEDLSELQNVYNGLSSACETVAKASLKLSQATEHDEGQPRAATLVPAASPATDDRRPRTDAKVSLLQSELNYLIRDLERKQRRGRAVVVFLKILSVLFASTVVVVLGLRVGSPQDDLLLRNLALILGVGILAMSTYEAFFDHRSAWVRRAATLSRLKNLRRDLMFAVSDAESAKGEDMMLKSIKRRLDAILQDELREWSISAEEKPAGYHLADRA